MLNPEAKYGTFVVDPPWHYGNKSTRNAAAKHYDTMSIDEIKALTIVPDHAADKSHLYLWSTSSHLPDAFSVIEAWGFTYKTYLVWIKPQMGMGNYFRVSTEIVLFGIRGGLRTTDRGIRNHFTASRRKHSQKPPEFLDLVERTSPGPYMEVFSRCLKSMDVDGAECLCSKCRLGWATWGDQS